MRPGGRPLQEHESLQFYPITANTPGPLALNIQARKERCLCSGYSEAARRVVAPYAIRRSCPADTTSRVPTPTQGALALKTEAQVLNRNM